METLYTVFQSGWASLEYYILRHTLTCLLPAFFLAGGMVTFLNREAILDILGEHAGRMKAFTLAAAASFLVAACSCTVIPVAAGLYFAGAGIGVAFIILWVAPAANILALTYTGSILGAHMVSARIAGALLVAYAIGWLMHSLFPREAQEGTPNSVSKERDNSPIIPLAQFLLLVLILLSLLAPNYLVQEGPYLHKVLLWGTITVIAAITAWKILSTTLLVQWLKETWWFIKVIIPLLLAGVFLVGVIQALLPETWVQEWLGDNTLRASLLATLIGAVSYFATMTEAPFVDSLMNMGMGYGPALTLLLVGPGISPPNWLAIARVFGIKKALVYVPATALFGAGIGWIFGNVFL
ncbi:permease [Balneolaceae bacterium ANBcel3]|nr:permease [Balneolaceae bacterium ANBcel3]